MDEEKELRDRTSLNSLGRLYPLGVGGNSYHPIIQDQSGS